jgi:hypothetical protein
MFHQGPNSLRGRLFGLMQLQTLADLFSNFSATDQQMGDYQFIFRIIPNGDGGEKRRRRSFVPNQGLQELEGELQQNAVRSIPRQFPKETNVGDSGIKRNFVKKPKPVELR